MPGRTQRVDSVEQQGPRKLRENLTAEELERLQK
jgi:hypothetical protein